MHCDARVRIAVYALTPFLGGEGAVSLDDYHAREHTQAAPPPLTRTRTHADDYQARVNTSSRIVMYALFLCKEQACAYA
jgi:hypothetical protein